MPSESLLNKLATEVGLRQVDAQLAAEVPERDQHISLLRDASIEIRGLRTRLELQDAKVQTMELLANLGRQHGSGDFRGKGGYGPDIAWLIDRAVERATSPAVAEAHAAAVADENIG